MPHRDKIIALGIPTLLGLLGATCVCAWVLSKPSSAEIRVPLDDPGAHVVVQKVDIAGSFQPGTGKPGELKGQWATFRGDGTNIYKAKGIKKDWTTPPKKLWEVTTGEGFAGPTIWNGRLYFLDYDQEKHRDALRCLSTDDGKEIWRRSYAVEIGRNHGISRTVCAVADGCVVSIGPKCQVMCLDAVSGDFKWGIDLPADYQTAVPDWYAGQNPLIDNGKVILAPGGTSLIMAVDLQTGSVVWKTPNPNKWNMTHSSVIPYTINGKKLYIYCASAGVVAVFADSGDVAFTLKEWKVSMANVPTPLPIPDNRIFFTGGYGAGSMMLQLEEKEGVVTPKILYQLKQEVFGAEQQTPIFYEGDIYGIIPVKTELVCLGLDGKQKWSSGAKNKYGLGSFMIADGHIIAINDTGTLSLIEASNGAFKRVTQAKVFEDGDECWGPMALVDGKLFARDLTRLACFDLKE